MFLFEHSAGKSNIHHMLDHLINHICTVRLHDLKLLSRIFFVKSGKNFRKQILGWDRRCRNGNTLAPHFPAFSKFFLNPFLQIYHLTGITIQRLTFCRQTDFFCISDKQPYFQFFLKRRDMRTDRRLCQVQILCRFGEATALCYLHKCF